MYAPTSCSSTWAAAGSAASRLDLARNVGELKHVRATFCVSRQNEIFEEFAGLGCRVLPVDTFEAASGALMRGYRVRTLYRTVLDELSASARPASSPLCRTSGRRCSRR